MKILELTSTGREPSKTAFIFSDDEKLNMVVYEFMKNNYGHEPPTLTTNITDGLHNNGGWEVKETYEQVLEKLREL